MMLDGRHEPLAGIVEVEIIVAYRVVDSEPEREPDRLDIASPGDETRPRRRIGLGPGLAWGGHLDTATAEGHRCAIAEFGKLDAPVTIDGNGEESRPWRRMPRRGRDFGLAEAAGMGQ